LSVHLDPQTACQPLVQVGVGGLEVASHGAGHGNFVTQASPPLPVLEAAGNDGGLMCRRVGRGNNKTALSSVGRGAVLEILWAKHPREFDSRRCLPSEPGDPAGDGAGLSILWGDPPCCVRSTGQA